jgi:hypothetical protein
MKFLLVIENQHGIGRYSREAAKFSGKFGSIGTGKQKPAGASRFFAEKLILLRDLRAFA